MIHDAALVQLSESRQENIHPRLVFRLRKAESLCSCSFLLLSLQETVGRLLVPQITRLGRLTGAIQQQQVPSQQSTSSLHLLIFLLRIL